MAVGAMAADDTSFVKPQRNVQGLRSILTSTACEWLLILMLLVDGVLSYLLTKFARLCQLQLPCILCSRLDHVLGDEKPDFYRNLLCGNHRSEISSLVCCRIHGKLADGHSMCDDCLSSFSTKSNPNPDMQRLLVGKLGFDTVGCGSPTSLLNKDVAPNSMSKKLCSCCNKPWVSRPNLQRLIQLKSPVTRVTKPNIPLPRRLCNRADLKKIRDIFPGSPVSSSPKARRSALDPSSPVGYSELKNYDFEFPFSHDYDGRSVLRDSNEAKNDVSKSHDVLLHLTPDVSSLHGLGEIKWQQPDQKTYHSLFLVDDIPPPPNTPGVADGVSTSSQSFNPSAPMEDISLVDMNPSFGVLEFPVGTTPEKLNVTGTTDTQHDSINQRGEILNSLNTAAGVDTKNDQFLNSHAPTNLTYDDTVDVSKLAAGGKGAEASELIEKEHDRFTELSLAENSSAQGIHSSMDDRSLNVQGNYDDFHITDASSSSGNQNVHKSEFAGFESFDGSTISEIEGESTIDRLKRQIEYDRKCLNALYKELDEERNAASIAANQAMAMITRLQEEKAGLHMEALQYLRMMEEQSEYDVETLDRANDLLAEREKDIQDLEAELDYFRLKYPDDVMVETLYGEYCDSKKENENVENTSLTHDKDDTDVPSDPTNAPPNSTCPAVSKGNDKPDGVIIPSWSEFEDGKLYIKQYLKSLEQKLQAFARYGTVQVNSDGQHIEKAGDEQLNQEESNDKEGSSVSNQPEHNALSNGSSPAEEGLKASTSEIEDVSKEEDNHLISNGKIDLRNCKDMNVVALANEFADLNERVEALEFDCNFLEHTFNFLQSGNEGLQFIQDIARQLQELRNIVSSRCQSVS